MTETPNVEKDAGPEDGHTFRFRFDSRGSSKVVGDPEHTDAPDFMGPVHEIQVRAWNLRDALHKAADLPFSVLMGSLVSDDALPHVCRHCGKAPEADGDHSCSCPNPDGFCPDHPRPEDPWNTTPPEGNAAERQGFVCPGCLRVGGRQGVDGDKWIGRGDYAICAACADPKEDT